RDALDCSLHLALVRPAHLRAAYRDLSSLRLDERDVDPVGEGCPQRETNGHDRLRVVSVEVTALVRADLRSRLFLDRDKGRAPLRDRAGERLPYAMAAGFERLARFRAHHAVRIEPVAPRETGDHSQAGTRDAAVEAQHSHLTVTKHHRWPLLSGWSAQ